MPCGFSSSSCLFLFLHTVPSSGVSLRFLSLSTLLYRFCLFCAFGITLVYAFKPEGSSSMFPAALSTDPSQECLLSVCTAMDRSELLLFYLYFGYMVGLSFTLEGVRERFSAFGSFVHHSRNSFVSHGHEIVTVVVRFSLPGVIE